MSEVTSTDAPPAPTTATMTPQLFPPNSNDASLSASAVPYQTLLGTWHVYAHHSPDHLDCYLHSYSLLLDPPSPLSTNQPHPPPPAHSVASTLPLWKNKKNVKITYTSIPGEPETTFEDLVEYNMRTDEVGKKSSTVKGVDKLEEGTGGRWKWRGKGFLMIASSRWQLLGYNLATPTSSSDPEWVVTYFASTLFTPSGLDIYSRSPKGLSDEFVESLVKGLVGLGGEMDKLCKDGGMFRIPQDG